VVAPFAYEGIARSAVHRLKYTGLRSLAPLMARPMADEARHLVLPSLVIVPIPLHPRRLRERGFNQSVLLAREVGRLLGIGVREEILFRRTQSGHQVDAVGAKARRANVADAFEASADASGLEVLLDDDVVTTGSTLAAAAEALGRAGASSVSGLAFSYEAKERRRERKPALSGLARGAPLS
jgi:ComF family protein